MPQAAAAGVLPVRPEGGVLAVHAHPDDETLSTGALLATWAASGHPVTVVTCTRGERGEVIALPGTSSEGLASLEGDGPALAAHRETELAAALEALGVRDHVFLDRVAPAGTGPARRSRYVDSGMAWIAPGIAGPAADSGPDAFARVPLDEPAERLAALIADRRPAVVVSYGPGGGYGHPDHVRAHEIAVRALALLDGPERPPLWSRVVPESGLREQFRALSRLRAGGFLPEGSRGLALPDADGDLPPVAVPVLGTGVSVEVGPVLPRLLAALAAHATQVQAVVPCPARAAEPSLAGSYALSNGVLAPLPSHEFYAAFAHPVPRRHPLSARPSTLGG